jgi:hypothetical protein
MAVSENLESKRLLNPAFCAAVLAKAVAGYEKDSSGPLPFLYSYLVLPLVLHPETRERLPSTVATRLITWVERNAGLMTHYPRRVADLAPAAREGLRVGSMTGLFSLNDSGAILPGAASKALAIYEKSSGSSEVTDCLKKATFVGRWLVDAGTTPTVLVALGVRI